MECLVVYGNTSHLILFQHFSHLVNRHGDRYLEYQILILHYACHAIKSIIEVGELSIDFQPGSSLPGWLPQPSAKGASSHAAGLGWLE